MTNRNRELLLDAARMLSPLIDELVFVGGCTTGLLITDPAAADVRTTYDVDAIAEITSQAEYYEFSERLRALGFSEDSSEDAPICRWKKDHIKLDVMPLDEKILGFSNRWYKIAMDTADEYDLEPGLRIRVVNAPYFLATKLEAFKGRGNQDFFASHDLEDMISVIDGRPSIVEELNSAAHDVRKYIAEQITILLSERTFNDALPGYLLPDAASQDRIGKLLKTLQTITTSISEKRRTLMTWEQIGPKLREFSSTVSVIKPHPEVETRIVEIVQELDALLKDSRNRPA
jgi:hypothetical protein